MAYYVLKRESAARVGGGGEFGVSFEENRGPGYGVAFRIGDASLHAVCGDGLYRDVGRGVVVVYGYSFAA